MIHGMKDNKAIKIPKETREAMISSIKNYFLKEREEEIGNLAAGLMLEFISEEIGPVFYNQGVTDSYTYMEEMIGDLLSIQK
jgi:uncharacterized protein (DUF2164 family)